MSLFPKDLWPFNYLTLTQNKPWVLWMLSIIWSFLPDNDWWTLPIRPVFLCKLIPIKAHWGTGSWSFTLERLAIFPPQADHVLDVFSTTADGGSTGGTPPQNTSTLILPVKRGYMEEYIFQSLRIGSTSTNTELTLISAFHCIITQYCKESITNSAIG